MVHWSLVEKWCNLMIVQVPKICRISFYLMKRWLMIFDAVVETGDPGCRLQLVAWINNAVPFCSSDWETTWRAHSTRQSIRSKRSQRRVGKTSGIWRTKGWDCIWRRNIWPTGKGKTSSPLTVGPFLIWKWYRFGSRSHPHRPKNCIEIITSCLWLQPVCKAFLQDWPWRNKFASHFLAVSCWQCIVRQRRCNLSGAFPHISPKINTIIWKSLTLS